MSAIKILIFLVLFSLSLICPLQNLSAQATGSTDGVKKNESSRISSSGKETSRGRGTTKPTVDRKSRSAQGAKRSGDKKNTESGKEEKKGTEGSGEGEKKEGEEDEDSEENLAPPKKLIRYRCPACFFTRDTPGPCPDDGGECLEVLPGSEDPDQVRLEEKEKSFAEMDLLFFKTLVEKSRQENESKTITPFNP